MNICDNGHDEVCFEENKCPVCILIEEYEDQLKELKETITDLEGQIFDLSCEVKSL
jgi:hypothetical protein